MEQKSILLKKLKTLGKEKLENEEYCAKKLIAHTPIDKLVDSEKIQNRIL